MEILLAWGADVNAETQGQQTPLHLAAFAGNSRDTLQLLIMHPDLRPQSFNCQQAGTYFCQNGPFLLFSFTDILKDLFSATEFLFTQQYIQKG